MFWPISEVLTYIGTSEKPKKNLVGFRGSSYIGTSNEPKKRTCLDPAFWIPILLAKRVLPVQCLIWYDLDSFISVSHPKSRWKYFSLKHKSLTRIVWLHADPKFSLTRLSEKHLLRWFYLRLKWGMFQGDLGSSNIW